MFKALLTSAAVLAAAPAFATGLQIEVKGEAANGTVTIDLFEDTAPLHVAQIAALASDGKYDGVVFHRVIDGFMAQTGDVQFGNSTSEDYFLPRAGTGGSELGNIVAEFGDISFEEGVVGMARAQDPNSANSQFFIMFAPAPHLDGDYTVIGKVTEGMDVVHAIKKGDKFTGTVAEDPDMMASVTVTE